MLYKHPAFNTAPTHGAFAKKGAWESAWIFSSSKTPSPAEIAKYIGNSNEVAFEAFFKDAFFGVRMSGETSSIEKFALTAVNYLCSAKDGVNLFQLMEQSGYVSNRSIIQYTEIGAVFEWKSVGSYKMDVPQQALLNWNDWWPELTSSRVGLNKTQHKAIEFAYNGPLPLWFGLPISSIEPPYTLSEQLLREALETAIDEY
jgi:hypothetical protein